MSNLKLKNLCLDYIKDNLSLFTSSYHSTKNENIKKNLLFLRRTYSQYFLDKLTLRRDLEMKEEYIDFLVNEYIIDLKLDFLLFNTYNSEKIIQKVISIAHNLQRVTVHHLDTYYTQLLEKLIPHLVNVKSITLTICNDKLLELIASSCLALTELDITRSTVTRKGINALCRKVNGLIQPNFNIKHLNVLQTQLEPEDIAFLLKYLPNLEVIDTDKIYRAIQTLYFNINDSNLQDAIKLNIRILHISEWNLQEHSRILNICSKTCLKLNMLCMKPFFEEDLNLVKCFPDLKELDLVSTRFLLPINNLLVFYGSKLTALSLAAFTLSVTILIENCPNLEILKLFDVLFEKLDENPTKLLNNLETFHLEQSENSHSMTKLLNSSPNLKYLTLKNINYFSEDDFTEEMLRFSLNSSLLDLSFIRCDVDIDFVQHFVLNSKSILCLDLVDNRLISRYQFSTFEEIMIGRLVIHFEEHEGDERYSDEEEGYIDEQYNYEHMEEDDGQDYTDDDNNRDDMSDDESYDVMSDDESYDVMDDGGDINSDYEIVPHVDSYDAGYGVITLVGATHAIEGKNVRQDF